MRKKFSLIGTLALLGASLFLLGCPTDPDDPPLSSNNSFGSDGVVIKGVTVTGFGSEDGTYGAPVLATVTISDTAANDTDGNPATTFNGPARSSVKAVKVESATAGAYAEETFNDSTTAAYANELIANNDVFIVKVTAENGAVKWYRITVTVESASNDATLASATVKGVAVDGFGGEDGTYGAPVLATVTISDTAATGSATTAFTATHAYATVTKVVKSSTVLANEVAFNSADPYTTGNIANNDVFYVKVTAENGTTVKWYQITVTVTSLITYTVTANGDAVGTATTALTLTFGSAPAGLADGDIAVGSGSGTVTKGTASATSPTVWTVPVTVTAAGTVSVTVTKAGVVDGSAHTVTVYKAGDAAPVLSGVTVEDLVTTGGTSATVKFTSDEAGTYHYVVLEDDADPPTTASAVKDASSGNYGSAAAIAGVNTIDVTGLTADTDYIAYIVVEDASEHLSTVLETESFTPSLSGTGAITVSFTGPENVDESITLSDVTSLSWTAGTELTVTVSNYGSSYRWALDGVVIEDEETNSITLDAGTLAVSQHTLTVLVKAEDEIEYSKSVTFTVAQ